MKEFFILLIIKQIKIPFVFLCFLGPLAYGNLVLQERCMHVSLLIYFRRA